MIKKRVPLVLTIVLILIMTPTSFPLSHETLANAKTVVSSVSPIVLTNDSSATAELSPNNSLQANTALPQISDHKITSSELATLKNELGIYDEGKNYTQVIDGHGTGFAPPSEQEWNTLASNLNSISSVNYGASTPPSVDQSATPWFPPIGNQGSQGSCVAWSIGYYIKTFQEAKEHNWNVASAQWISNSYPGYPSQDYQSEIMSPAFVYNLQNGGVDNGLTFSGAIDLVSNVGICSWQKMPYSNVGDCYFWPSEDAWTEAALYRSDSSSAAVIVLYNSDSGLLTLKNWLSSGNLASIAVDANKFSNMNGGNVWTLDNYVNPSPNHAGTVVGYDDNKAYVENGATHYGAFKIANSWGAASWGFYWISYAAMEQQIRDCFVFNDLLGYMPQLEATFNITCADRGDCTVEVGLGNPINPAITKYFSVSSQTYAKAYVYGGNWQFCQNPIVLDITEFENYVSNPFNQPYFLYVYDGSGNPATVNSFSVNYAQSSNVPSQLTSGQSVSLSLTLPTFNTTWNNPILVNSDKDSVDQKIASASDTNGNMYVAYSDLYPSTGKTAIFIRESTDGGQTWPLVTTAASSTYNLANPSIAINPNNNEVYVAAELEVSASEHQIWVLRFVNGQWSWNVVASASGQDYRFPSITSEYQYGASNRQYISFEYVNNNDDRDLMFAKTIDHGATWTVTKLHGALPDNNVYTQTSITNGGGNIFIAYRFGADYNSVSEIRVDRSSDFGATWTQTTGVSGLPNDCQFPSIAATTSGNSVIVAFQYQASTNNVDIMYSYSTDNGASWIKQQSLFASSTVDEKNVKLVASGTGSIYAMCKAGIYAEYASTPNLQPPGWSPAKTISDGWIGDGLGIGVFPNNYCPYAVWTDSRTKNISFSMNAAPLAFYIYASANTVDQGQSSSLSSTTLTSGTPPYHYQWLQKTPGSVSFNSINGATSPNYSFLTSSSTTTGTWSFELQITDSANIPVTLTSNILNVQVNLPPTVSITPSSPVIDVGQSIPFVASASGGSGIYSSYQWYLNGSPLSGQTSSTFNYVPSSPGSASVTVSVTDSVSVTSPQSTEASVTVNPALTPPSASASLSSVIQGQSSTLTITGLTGGTSPYSYQWLMKTPGASTYISIGGATSSTYTFSTSTSTTLGVWSFELQVSDSASVANWVNSSVVFVQVNVPPPVSVGFGVSGLGSDVGSTMILTIDGASYSYAQLQFLSFTWVPGSQHSVTASASLFGGVGKQYMFVSWMNGGGLSGSSGTFTTPGSGTTVTVNYTAQFVVSFAASPSWAGSVSPSGSAVWYNTGTITVSASAGSGYYFSYWSSSSISITFANPYSVSTSVTIGAMGTIKANFVTTPPAPSVSVSPGSWSMDIGQSKVFTATASGGSGVYVSYQWYVNGSAVSGQTSSTFNYVPSRSYLSSITVTVTDSLGATSVQSPAATVLVNSAFALPSPYATPSVVNQGQSSVISINYFGGGTSPFSCQWLVKAPGDSGYSLIGGATSSSYTFSTSSSTVVGVWSFEVQVTDSASLPVTATSNAASIQVSSSLSTPSVSVSPGSWSMDIGQSKVFTATASGGSGVYVSYQWYVNGSAVSGQTSSTFNYVPSRSYLSSITVTVTDSLGATSVQSPAATVLVNSAFALPSPYATPSVVNQGQSSVISINYFGGGTSPFSCQWLVKAPGDSGYSLIGGATSSSYTFSTSSSTVVGVWSFEVQVTDSASLPVTATSNAASIQVSSSLSTPSVSVSPGSWSMDIGQSKVFTATASGGSGVYVSYQWYVNGSAVSGQTSSTFNYVPSRSYLSSITVTVTDSLGATSVQSPAATVLVNSAFALPSPYATPSVVNQGQSSVISINYFGGGTSPFSCQWLVKAPGDSGYSLIGGATSSSYTFSTSSSTVVGVWSFEVQVTDSASLPVTATSNAASIQVSSSPPSSVSVGFGLSGVNGDVGSSIILTVDGMSYSYAQLQSLSFTWVPGSQHSVTASASLFGGVGKQYMFVSWTNGGGLSGSSGTFTTPGSGTTVTVNYTAQFVVSFAASPSWAGSVSPSGSAVWYNTGTITVSASAGSGYYFSYWSSSSGATTFANPYSSSTSVTIGGSGTITANFVSSPPASVTVAFALNGVGSDVGSGTVLAIDGTSYSYAQLQFLSFTWVPGSQHQVVASTPISSGVGKQYAFYIWTNGNGLLGSSGTFTVPPYSTTVTATFTTQFLVSFVASPSFAGSVTPSGTIWRDTGMYSISASPISGYYLSYWSSTSGSITFGNPNAASTSVSIVGPGTITANFNPIPSAPSVTLSPGSWSMDIGQSKVFTATASGGSGVYVSYQWYVNGSLQPGQTSSTFNYAPVSPFFGSFLITVTVTDSLGITSAQSSPALVTVNSALVVTSAYATQSSVIQGQSSTLSLIGFGGGFAPYYYQWLVKAPGAGVYSLISGATASTYTFSTSSSTAVGVWSFEVQITDSASVPTTATSNTVSVQVSASPPPFVFIGFGLNGVGSDVGSALILTVDGVSYSYAQLQSLSFTWVPGSQHTVAAADSLFGGVGKQYVFVSWTNGGGLSGSSGTFTVPTSATTVIVNYTAQFVVSFAASPSWAGSVSPSYTAVWENAGALSVSASAGSGYSFSYWSSSSGAITFANPYSVSTFVTIGGMGTIKANFVIATTAPTSTMTFGVGSTNSGVSYAPSGRANVVAFLLVNGFKPNTLLAVTGSLGVPLGWTNFASGGYSGVTTDASGSATGAVSATGTAPASGIYSVAVTDGSNTVTVLLTITAAGTSFFVLSPTSGVQGTTVSVIGFGATSTSINFDGVSVGTTQCVGNAWPYPPTQAGLFTVPPSGAGVHSVTASGFAGSASFTIT